MTVAQAPLAGFVPIPEERARRYRKAGCWTGTTLAEALLARARDQPRSRVALASGSQSVTYGALVSAVEAVAGGLFGLGLRRQDRVLVQLPNCPEFVILVLALWRLGAIPVMALAAHREYELHHLLAESGAVAMAVPGRSRRIDHLGMARALRAEHASLRTLLVAGPVEDRHWRPAEGETSLVALAAGRVGHEPQGSSRWASPDDVALLLLSGGTTGLPKLIPRTHQDYLYNLCASSEICALSGETVYLAALPVAHNFALGCPGVMGTLLLGGRVVLAPSTAPRVVFELMSRQGVTITSAVPSLAMQWAEAATERGPIGTELILQVGGARLLPEAARRLLEALGCRLQQVYGMAEGLLCFTRLDDPEELVIGTQGRPASPDDEVRIAGQAGREVPAGELGEVQARGPYTIAGYFRAEEHNARAFTPDGFFSTGDLARRLPQGHLVVEGRVKDVINRGGEKVAGVELENLILAHPAVAEVAVVSTPDPMLGEAICVCAVLRPGGSLTLADLRAFLVQRRIARYKLPDRLLSLETLPLTPVGKVDKAALRRRFVMGA